MIITTSFARRCNVRRRKFPAFSLCLDIHIVYKNISVLFLKNSVRLLTSIFIGWSFLFYLLSSYSSEYFQFCKPLRICFKVFTKMTVTAAPPLTLTSLFYYDLTLELVTKRVIKSVKVYYSQDIFWIKNRSINKFKCIFIFIRKVIFIAIFISHIVDFNFSCLTLCLMSNLLYAFI